MKTSGNIYKKGITQKTPNIESNSKEINSEVINKSCNIEILVIEI